MFEPKNLDKYPTKTGVYLMKDPSSQVIYIGKANNLRNRLKQYFIKGRDTRAMVGLLTTQVEKIDTIIVDTEKEALILENNLIKKYKPKYNILLKDDKTYVSLVVTNEKWPIIKLVRKKSKEGKKDKYFGPFTNAKAARQTLDLILKLFPIRQCSDNVFKNRTRPCILYEIKKCLGPCTNRCTEEEYRQMIDYASSLLKGKNKEVLKDLQEKMQEASENLEYEKAQKYLEMINQINHVLQIQHVENLSAKDCDALGIFQDRSTTVISKLIFREGRLIGSGHFSFTETAQDLSSILESFLLQEYQKKQYIPTDILIPIDLKNKNILSEIFQSFSSKKTNIVFPKKGEKLSLVNMACKNAEEMLKREKDTYQVREKLLLNLQSELKLTRFPRHIECFDTSHISETNRVASLVTYINGKEDKSKMKLFIIKTKEQGDTAALEEILLRHLSKADKYCDLLIVDGGKAQLNVALKVLKLLNIASIDVIGLAKQGARHDKGLTKEQVFIPFEKDPVIIDPASPLLFILQEIRDEAHRKAISFHRKKRGKLISKSLLEDIEGIGPLKKKALLKHFKSIEKIKNATEEELEELKMLSKKDVENIIHFFLDK